jgi:hypothetical protein
MTSTIVLQESRHIFYSNFYDGIIFVHSVANSISRKYVKFLVWNNIGILL